VTPATEPGSPGSPEETTPRRGPLERQLNVGLMVVLVSAALLVVYGVAFAASAWDGDGERSRSEALGVSIVFLILPGMVVLFTAYSARRRLTAQVVSARLFSVLAGRAAQGIARTVWCQQNQSIRSETRSTQFLHR